MPPFLFRSDKYTFTGALREGLEVFFTLAQRFLRPFIFINILKCPSKFYYFTAAVTALPSDRTQILSLLPEGMKRDSRS